VRSDAVLPFVWDLALRKFASGPCDPNVVVVSVAAVPAGAGVGVAVAMVFEGMLELVLG